MEALLETMEILANPEAMRAIRRDQSGKGKHLPLSVLEEALESNWTRKWRAVAGAGSLHISFVNRPVQTEWAAVLLRGQGAGRLRVGLLGPPRSVAGHPPSESAVPVAAPLPRAVRRRCGQCRNRLRAPGRLSRARVLQEADSSPAWWNTKPRSLEWSRSRPTFSPASPPRGAEILQEALGLPLHAWESGELRACSIASISLGWERTFCAVRPPEDERGRLVRTPGKPSAACGGARFPPAWLSLVGPTSPKILWAETADAGNVLP